MERERQLKILAAVLSVFFLAVFVKEVHIATKYAGLAELGFSEALELWGREHSTNENFSGAELGVILRIDRAIYSFVIFVLISFMAFWSVRYRAQAT